MNVVDAALYSKMTGDTGGSGLNSLSNGGFHQIVAKDEAVFNYTVFHCLIDLPEYAFGNVLTHETIPYQIKHYAVDGANNTTTSGPVLASSMQERCRAILHNASLNVSGKTVLSCVFDRSIPDGAERDEAGDRWVYSKGGIYLLVIV